MSESEEHIPLTEAVYYILLALHEPRHGYAIMQFIKAISHERVHLGPGTLYGAIKNMLEKGWIQAVNNDLDSRRKEYELTPLGRKVVLAEINRLEELIENGKKIMGDEKVDR